MFDLMRERMGDALFATDGKLSVNQGFAAFCAGEELTITAVSAGEPIESWADKAAVYSAEQGEKITAVAILFPVDFEDANVWACCAGDHNGHARQNYFVPFDHEGEWDLHALQVRTDAPGIEDGLRGVADLIIALHMAGALDLTNDAISGIMAAGEGE